MTIGSGRGCSEVLDGARLITSLFRQQPAVSEFGQSCDPASLVYIPASPAPLLQRIVSDLDSPFPLAYVLLTAFTAQTGGPASDVPQNLPSTSTFAFVLLLLLLSDFYFFFPLSWVRDTLGYSLR